MNDTRYILDSEDVLDLNEDAAQTVPYKTILGEDVLKTFATHIQSHLQTILSDNWSRKIASGWVKEGQSCDLLVPEKHWKRGKVKLALVFEPDEEELEEVQEVENKEPESLLDDIRQSIQAQKNSENEA